MINETRPSKLLTAQARDTTNVTTRRLYGALRHNSLLNFKPQSPLYIFHSQEDTWVPFLNGEHLYKSFQSHGISNVEYDFGSYGDHMCAGVEFIKNVFHMLPQRNAIDKKKRLERQLAALQPSSCSVAYKSKLPHLLWTAPCLSPCKTFFPFEYSAVICLLEIFAALGLTQRFKTLFSIHLLFYYKDSSSPQSTAAAGNFRRSP